MRHQRGIGPGGPVPCLFFGGRGLFAGPKYSVFSLQYSVPPRARGGLNTEYGPSLPHPFLANQRNALAPPPLCPPTRLLCCRETALVRKSWRKRAACWL